MFTPADLRAIRQARPFVPFRLWLSDGGYVDARSPEVVIQGKRFAIVGLLDPDAQINQFLTQRRGGAKETGFRGTGDYAPLQSSLRLSAFA